MNQTELFPTSDVVDNRCEKLYNYLKQNWIINRVTPIFNVEKLMRCGKMYKVDCETVLKESERLLNNYYVGSNNSENI